MSEIRRGADYTRVTAALTVMTTDLTDALAIAWDAFRVATGDDVTGWEMSAALACYLTSEGFEQGFC